MKATGLPIQTNATPVAVEPLTAALPGAPTQTGADFMGMLMQLLGSSAPAAASTVTLTKDVTSDSTAVESEDPAALAAMLAVPLAIPLPWAALPTVVVEGGADPVELLGLGSGKQSTDSLLTLETSLAETLTEPAAAGDTNDSIGSLSPFNETLSARSTQAEATAARPLHTPVGTKEWADELGTRLTWMVDRGQQSASLRLSPDNLGPLEVRISITDDKASVWFGAAHADTRAAIELALPRLREMFTAQGLSLADAGVFQEPPRDRPAPAPRNGTGKADADQREGEVIISKRGIGLLDAYA